MTTAEHIRSIASSKTSDVSIAGVPWPRYKVIALVAGLVVAVVVGIVTTNTAPTVLVGAAVGTLVWLGLGAAQHLRG
ncbi:MAG TPA: hypothetical protein VFB19_12535 [Mycobacterium sp.]|nr:hypothetical protein [Mycobacterium sp.]